MGAGKVLLGLLAGVAAGAMLGILFAPEKGTVTRRKITKKGEDYADALKEKFDEFVDNVTDKYLEAKEDVTDFAQKGKAKLNEPKKGI
jgi:gas vesicle protein